MDRSGPTRCLKLDTFSPTVLTQAGLERLRRDTEKLTQMVDGSGLRLSQRTLQAMKSIERFFDPYEFDWDRYKILLYQPP